MKTTLVIVLSVLLISFNNSSFRNPEIEEKIRKTFYPQALLNDSISYKDWIAKDSLLNKELWYLEVQYPFPTSYTSYWNSNHENQYFANTEEFASYFENSDSILMAIQVGPTLDLWAFQQFLFKKLDDKIIVSNSYFRHNRFVYKGFAILTKIKFEAFYKRTIELRKETVRTFNTLDYEGRYVNIEVDLNNLSTTEIEIKCPNRYTTSGIIVDNTKNIITKLYGFSDSQCEQDERVEKMRVYQNENWWKEINEFEWIETYSN